MKKKIPNFYTFNPKGYKLMLVGENVTVEAYCPSRSKIIFADVLTNNGAYRMFNTAFTTSDSPWSEYEIELACRDLLTEYEKKYDPDTYDPDNIYYNELTQDEDLFPWENME